MFGERLAELRKLNDDTQQILADKIGFSVWAVRAWEQEKNWAAVFLYRTLNQFLYRIAKCLVLY